MDEAKISGILEAILFVAGDPVSVSDVAHAFNLTESEMDGAIDRLRDHATWRSGASASTGSAARCSCRFSRVCVLCRYVFAAGQTADAVPGGAGDAVHHRLRQPVTKQDIESVRGVKCDYSVQALMNKNLIREAGRKEALGRPSSMRPRTSSLGTLASPRCGSFRCRAGPDLNELDEDGSQQAKDLY